MIRKIMMLLSLVSIVVCLYYLNEYTPSYTVGAEIGGNGNAALVFVWPLSLPVLYISVVVFLTAEKFHSKYAEHRRKFAMLYSSIIIVIVAISVWRIGRLQQMMQQHFDYPISYLNSYSNTMFFNIFTLAALISLVALSTMLLPQKKRLS